MERGATGAGCGARRRTRAGIDVQPRPPAGSARRGIAGHRARSAKALDRLAREPLADHVELIEARIMQGDRAAWAFVHGLHLYTQDVAQLALERGDVGIALTGV